MRELAMLFLLIPTFTGCASVETNSKLTIRAIKENCKELVGKRVELLATYMGWSCPRDCKNPGITRSDTCFIDNTGCIYAKGLAGLDPLTDKGKRIELKALVKEKRGTCYLEVLRKDEVK